MLQPELLQPDVSRRSNDNQHLISFFAKKNDSPFLMAQELCTSESAVCCGVLRYGGVFYRMWKSALFRVSRWEDSRTLTRQQRRVLAVQCGGALDRPIGVLNHLIL